MSRNTYIYKDVDFTGQRFGKLTVIRKADKGRSWWVCKCDCGNVVTLVANKMVTYKSCGCGEKYNREHLGEHNRTHGKTETRLYRTWCKMKERCNNPNIEHYPEYGGRGIKVCAEWNNSFEDFQEWAYSVGYDDSLDGNQQSLDRIDVQGNYEPNNCRWTTHKEQMRNTTRTIYVDYQGKQIPMSAFCEEHGITYESFVTRHLKRGFTVEELLRIWEFRQGKHEGYYSIQEAAEHYGVCQRSIKDWIDKGRLNGEKVGTSWFIPCGQEIQTRADRNERGQFLPGIKRPRGIWNTEMQ